MKKKITQSKFEVNIYKILAECIDEGIECGWNRAHKHTDCPSEDALKQAIYDAIMLEICEKFSFGDDE